ncbi:MAG: hypothetical protein NT020_07035 [Chloroflexales bacterium]|nr:hypothetical protein [Chloroflexales bacterium]
MTFHHENKLRTVIWDFAGEAIPEEIMHDLATLRGRIHRREHSLSLLDTLLSPEEIQALQRRVERLLSKGKYPQPSSERSYPWPPV